LHKKGYGLKLSTLQSEKPVSLGWLLFSMFTMDIETLKLSVTDAINGIPVGLHWKMISLGIQGMVKQEDQVKALPIYVNEMDMLIAKLCLVTLYES